MIQARVQNGRIEFPEPLPREWEGIVVNIAPATPDDEYPDIEASLAELRAMGPMEYEPGEKEEIEKALREMDELGRAQMARIAGLSP